MADDDLDITLRDPDEPPSSPADAEPEVDPEGDHGDEGGTRRRWPWFVLAGFVLLMLIAGLVWWLVDRSGDEHFALIADPSRLEGVTGTEIFTTVTAENADDLVWFAVSTEGGDAFRPTVTEAFVGRELGVSIRPRFGDAGDGSISITVVGCGVEEERCPEAEQEEASIDIPIEVAEPNADDVPDGLTSPLGARIVEEEGTSFVEDELVLILDPSLSEEDGAARAREIASDTDTVISGADPSTGIYQLALRGASLDDIRELVAEIRTMDGVEDAVIEPLVPAPSSVESTHATEVRDRGDAGHDEWHHEVLSDSEVRDLGSPNVRVAIVDTGIYPDHNDLDENATDHRTYGGTLSSANSDHGTHVAGLACGAGADDVTGTTNNCNLATYDVGPIQRLGEEDATLSTIAIYRAMIDAARDGSDVINLSLGSGPPTPGYDGCVREVPTNWDDTLNAYEAVYRNAFTVVRREVGDRVRREPLWVFAAGNDCVDASLTAPASLEPEFPENLLIVASIDEDEKLSPFSNAGTVAQVAAPGGYSASGSMVESTTWKWCESVIPLLNRCSAHDPEDQRGRSGGFVPRSTTGGKVGTSMAAPEVAGVAALVQSNNPDYSAEDVKNCIIGSSTDTVTFYGNDTTSLIHPVQDDSLELDDADVDDIVVVDALGAYLCEGDTPATPTPRPPPVTAPGSTTSIIMDVSTSMEDYTSDGSIKIRAAQQAADDVITTLQSEADLPGAQAQEASVVAFSSDADLYHSSSTDLASVREVVDTLSTFGDTNIGAGLDIAFGELVGRPVERRIAILLSDGETNTGLSADEILRQIVPSYTDAGIKIFTIGFGEPGSFDEDLLQQLATQTGGTYSYAETTQALQHAFIRSRHEATGRVVSETEGVASANTAVDAGTFDVTADEGLVNISLAAESAGLDIVLVDPLGNTVDVSGGNVQITDVEGLSTAFVTAPLPGQWHLEVRGGDRADGESYYAIVSVRKRETDAPTAPVTSRERTAAAMYVSLVGAILILLVLTAWHATSVVTSEPRRPRGRRRRGQGHAND